MYSLSDRILYLQATSKTLGKEFLLDKEEMDNWLKSIFNNAKFYFNVNDNFCTINCFIDNKTIFMFNCDDSTVEDILMNDCEVWNPTWNYLTPRYYDYYNGNPKTVSVDLIMEMYRREFGNILRDFFFTYSTPPERIDIFRSKFSRWDI